MQNIMSAWGYHNHAITLGKKAIPLLNDHGVLIKNTAIGLNPVDWKLIEGNLGERPAGFIPGVDGAGVIVAVGKKVQYLEIGARVAYHTNLALDGSFSQYTAVDARALIVIPPSVNDIAAAAFPCPGLTAWQAVQKLPKVSGKKILVNGAGGVVGSLITQMLVQQGAQVYAVASSQRHQQLNHLGVIYAIDYHQQDWLNTLLAYKFYAAFDMVSGESAATLAPLLEYYGHLISIQDRVESAPLPAFTTSISLHEIALASQHIYGSNKQWQELTQAGNQLLTQISRQALTLPSIEIISFNNIDQALAELKELNNGIKYVAIFD